MGTLFLVATPIGNLEDITLRALRILREVSLIAAEDTRHTRKLLTHFDISTSLTSYHEHSGPTRTEAVVAALATGDVALVSDAGTPLLSDPGQALVRAALAEGHTVIPIPGSSAAIAALVASGLPTDQFTFLGFLPRKSSDRRALLARFVQAPETLILYEAPHRLLACLDDALATLGDRNATLARELTKVHEEFRRGRLSALRAEYERGAAPRGEFTIVISGAEPIVEQEAEESLERRAVERIQALLASGVSVRETAVEVARLTGLPRRQAYRLALEVSGENTSQRATDSDDDA
ncbi:MAG TPA: 16S rRNA (cytidine(1402)-2'-O)-methyltransferase [Ktedonobacterales bacterium]|jgi:16S rRNA (cytidine1402-2'-O)-methyltransferase